MSCNTKQPSSFPGRTHPRACVCAVCEVGVLVLDCWLNKGLDAKKTVVTSVSRMFTCLSFLLWFHFTDDGRPEHFSVDESWFYAPGQPLALYDWTDTITSSEAHALAHADGPSS